ncbi:hypothetical protein Syun_000105 [Stephania yunnanensis]|uniref:Epidermal patterning factor-like protein n=1 Tax=Stephania yunnanensis TaxID=152371 RepID=A0AAP0Q593_9MAGN
MDHHRRTNRAPLLCLFTCVLSVFALLFTTTNATATTTTTTTNPLCPDSRNRGADCYVQVEGGDRPLDSTTVGIPRRYLSGPGSHPPMCTSKCGRCTPCQPVHVAVPPGTRAPAEYYPEAWRCKCGDRLYMP